MSLVKHTNQKTSFGEAFGFKNIDVPISSLTELGEGTNVELNDVFIFDKDVVKIILMSVELKDNLLLWGDAGAGKTDLIEQVAARLNRQAFIISFGEETSIRQLIGSFTISKGETPFRDGILMKAIKTPHAIIGLDEINMAYPGVVAMLNHLLQKREIIIPETGDIVKVAEGVRFFATSNTNMGVDESGLFEGSQSQNAATRSRFAGLQIKYLKPEQELELINKAYPYLNKEIPEEGGKLYAEQSVKLANMLRDAMRSGGLSLPFSVRQLHRFIKASLRLSDPVLAFKYSYWNLLDSTERQTAGDLFQTVFGLKVTD